MQCDDCEIMISSLVDGERPTFPPEDLFLHLAGCAGCREFHLTLLRIKNAEAEMITEGLIPATAFTSRGVRYGDRRTDPARGTHGILRRKISISVSSAAIALVLLALWTGVISFMIIRGEGPGARDERGEYQQQYMRSHTVQPAMDFPSPDSR